MQINFPIYLINKYKTTDPVIYFCLKSETEGMFLTVQPDGLSSQFQMDAAYIASKLHSLSYSQENLITRESFTEALQQANNAINEWLPAEQYEDENTEDGWGAYDKHQEADGRSETRRQDIVDMPVSFYPDIVVHDEGVRVYDSVNNKINHI